MFKNKFYALIICTILLSCQSNTETEKASHQQYLVVLGTLQDAGFPHINYSHEFEAVAAGTLKKGNVVSLGLIDKEAGKKWLFEATPDMPRQLYELEKHLKTSEQIVDGIFLTHAHIGHYTGLMYFGKEAMNAKGVRTYVMPEMKYFLENNGPWNQLVTLQNLALQPLQADSTVHLNTKLKVTPFLVPHRDEYTETVGYRIEGPEKSALFIPDINKWHLWERNLVEEVRKVDYAFLDATFMSENEINRPMNEVPHPYIQETVALLENEPRSVKAKVIFIHFNHSNPARFPQNHYRKQWEAQGFKFAKEGLTFQL